MRGHHPTYTDGGMWDGDFTLCRGPMMNEFVSHGVAFLTCVSIVQTVILIVLLLRDIRQTDSTQQIDVNIHQDFSDVGYGSMGEEDDDAGWWKKGPREE